MTGRARIRVEAAGVNRADLLQLAGDYSPPAGESDVPGLECAGVVLEDPSGRWQRGARVAALLASGGYDDEVAVDPGLLLPMGDLDPVEAAVLPEALCTIWWNLVGLARAQPGERLLVTGANSGVGHLAVSAARELGLLPIASARDSVWAPRLLERGAIGVINAHDEGALAQLDSLAPHGVDIALDLTGGTTAGLLPERLAHQGRWLIVGLLGSTSAALDMRAIIRRRLVITGSSLRSLPLETKLRIVRGVADDVWPAVLAGRIRADIAGSFPRSRSAAAHEMLAAGGVFGKIALVADAPARPAGQETDA